MKVTGLGRREPGAAGFPRRQRDAVLSIVAGLDEDLWHRPVMPSGWTPAGLVEHWAGQSQWFQGRGRQAPRASAWG